MTDKPRLMSRAEAATYCGFSPEQFSRHVAAGRLPKPVPGMKRWDRVAIDKTLDDLAGLSKPETEEDRYAAWEREWDAKEAERAKRRSDSPN